MKIFPPKELYNDEQIEDEIQKLRRNYFCNIILNTINYFNNCFK